MSTLEFVSKAAVLVLVGGLGIYIAARLIFAAYFTTKTDHERNERDGTHTRTRVQPGSRRPGL